MSSPLTEKEDRRIALTKKLLKDALLELLADTPIYQISVTDVCERASVSRGAFYAHYTDPRQLLREMEEEVFQQIYQHIRHELPREECKPYSMEDLLVNLEQHSQFFLVILKSERGMTFLGRLFNLAVESMYTEIPNHTHNHPEEQAQFVVGGSVAVILSWFQNGRKTPVQKVAEQLEALIGTVFREAGQEQTIANQSVTSN